VSAEQQKQKAHEEQSRQQFDEQLAFIKKKNAEHIELIEKQHKKEIERLEGFHNKEVDQLKKDHEFEVQELLKQMGEVEGKQKARVTDIREEGIRLLREKE